MLSCADFAASPSPTREAIDAAVAKAVGRFQQAYKDVRAAQEADEVWNIMKNSLAKFEAASWIREWYVHHQLAACRRAIDKDRRDDVNSIVRALCTLCSVADHLTVEVLEARLAPGPADGRFDGLMALNLARLRDAAGSAASEWEPPGRRTDWPANVPPLGRDTIDRELAYIEALGADVRKLATGKTAHQLSKDQPEVRADQVRDLISQLAAIYRRWMLVLDVKTIDTKTDHLTTGSAREFVRALDLYDREAWFDARRRVLSILHKVGVFPTSYEDVENSIVARYELE